MLSGSAATENETATATCFGGGDARLVLLMEISSVPRSETPWFVPETEPSGSRRRLWLSVKFWVLSQTGLYFSTVTATSCCSGAGPVSMASGRQGRALGVEETLASGKGTSTWSGSAGEPLISLAMEICERWTGTLQPAVARRGTLEARC